MSEQEFIVCADKVNTRGTIVGSASFRFKAKDRYCALEMALPKLNDRDPFIPYILNGVFTQEELRAGKEAENKAQWK